MGNKQAINLTSLNLIHYELMVTIDSAATHLETFISERDNIKVLQDCIDSLLQIRGSLDLVQLHGACELAGEILTTATEIDLETKAGLDEKLAALTKGFFVLSCYFEYTQQHEIGMPVLLVPYINDIRRVNGQSVMPECYFEDFARFTLPKGDRCAPIGADFTATIRRFRHMYQVGLLGFIKEVNIPQSLKLMQRAISKVHRLSVGYDSETFWWLASCSLDAMSTINIVPTMLRKRVVGQLDKSFRDLEKNGLSVLDQFAPDDILKELAYYVAIADVQQPEHQKIKRLFGFEHIGYTDSILQQQMVSLTGPNANTVRSVADVLRVELNTVKESIEKFHFSNSDDDVCYDDSIARLQKSKEILSIVGLTSAAAILAAPLEKLQTCHDSGNTVSSESATELADALLYVDSVLSSLEKRNFSGEKLSEINRLTQSEMVSANHLENAQLMVIEQAETGFTTIKNLLTAFRDSNYDQAQLGNIVSIMDEIRGGMIVLSLPRAADIVASCTSFIEQTLMSTEETAALEQLLETFADALICLEYYLDCMKVDKNVSADTLIIAEDSLAALGYGIS